MGAHSERFLLFPWELHIKYMIQEKQIFWTLPLGSMTGNSTKMMLSGHLHSYNFRWGVYILPEDTDLRLKILAEITS